MSRLIKVSVLLLALSMPHMSVFAQSVSEQYERGMQAYSAGEYPEAYIHLKNALQADPRYLPARLLLAKVHFNAGDVAGAAKESEEALALGADLNLVLPIYGTALILQRRVDALFALEKDTGSLTRENRFEWALLKGQGYLLRGEEEAAQRSFEEAADMFPADVRSNNTLAAIYLQSGMLEESAKRVEKSLLLDPDNVKTLELRADLALREGRLEAARADLERAHELDATDLRVLRGLARVSLLEGDLSEVEHYLALILEESPSDPAATLLSAVIEISRGEEELGDAMLSELSLKLSELDGIVPQSSDEMLFIQASSDYLRKSDRSAIGLFNTYLNRRPNDLAAIRMLANLYVRNGEERRARELLASSRDAIVADVGLTILLLRLYIEEGSEYNAREVLADLRLQLEDDVLVNILEAELDRSVGRPEEALALLPERDYATAPASYGLLRGALLLDLNNVDEAAALAGELQVTYPGKVRVHNLAAIAELRRRNLQGAADAIATALEIDPGNLDARFNQAMLLKQRGQSSDAALQINEILAERPDHVRAIMLMATILLERGSIEEAIDWSDKVYAYDKMSVLPGEFQLRIYMQTGDWDNALQTALQLSKNDPINETYLVQLATIYGELDQSDIAQRPLRSLYALRQTDPAGLRELAALQVRSGNIPEARLSLETALEQTPGDYELQLDLVRLYILDGDYEFAATQLEALESRFGARSGLAEARGEIALARGALTSAQSEFMRAFELDNDNGNAVGRLYELSLQGIGGQAFVETLEKALQEGSLPGWAVRLLADSLVAQKQNEKAARYYELLLEHPDFNRDASVLNNLANIYAETDLDKARSTAMRALEVDGGNSAAVLDTVGWILTRQRSYEDALPYLRRAYTIDSRDPEIRYHTAVALRGLGRNAEAEKELRAALAHPAPFPGRVDAEELLQSLFAD